MVSWQDKEYDDRVDYWQKENENYKRIKVI